MPARMPNFRDYKNPNIEQFEEGDYERGQRSFGDVLMNQVNDCRKLFNGINGRQTDPDVIADHVDMFEVLLVNYVDKEYTNKNKELFDQHMKHISGLSPADKLRQDAKLKRIYYKNKFRLLLILMKRSGFAMHTDIGAEV